MAIKNETKAFTKKSLVNTTNEFYLVVRENKVVENKVVAIGDYVIVAKFFQETVTFFTYFIASELGDDYLLGMESVEEYCAVDLGETIPDINSKGYMPVCSKGVEVLRKEVDLYYSEVSTFMLKVHSSDKGSSIDSPLRKVRCNMVMYSANTCTELVNKRNIEMENQYYCGEYDQIMVYKNMLIGSLFGDQLLYELVVSVDVIAGVYTTALVNEEFLNKWYPSEDIPAKIKTGVKNQEHLFAK